MRVHAQLQLLLLVIFSLCCCRVLFASATDLSGYVGDKNSVHACKLLCSHEAFQAKTEERCWDALRQRPHPWYFGDVIDDVTVCSFSVEK